MYTPQDIEHARHWLQTHAHGTTVRHILERGLEYCDAVEKAGICIETVDGEDLYSFLADPQAAASRHHWLIEPTL
ncbi:hypothetical protein RAS1_05180 [Phycisphaerae bacterium RAS1]|nr:hypothetical protein RAS1_05180 [Phycisphaerae bacterium RAS1]